MTDVRRITEEIRAREMSLVLPRIRRHAKGPPLQILEVGAGTGANARSLTTLGPVVAVEPHAAFDEVPGVTFVRAAAERLPFEDGRFDLIFSTSVLEHLDDVGRGLAEMRRVLAPGGVMVHVVPTTVWKALAVAAHYAILGRGLLRRLGVVPAPPRQSAAAGEWRTAAGGAVRRVGRLARLVPEVHGNSASNREELLDFLPARWRARFADAGLRLIEEQPLLTYSPPEMLLFPPTARGAYWGLSSCRAYYLRAG